VIDNLDNPAAVDWTAFYESHPPSVSNVPFCFRGFPDEAERSQITNAAGFIVDFVSLVQPLQDLDGITYAYDYAEALATLDTGIETQGTLTATSDAFGQGVAMAPAVKRDGKLKTHVVIFGKLGLDLLSKDAAEKELAVHTLVHELGHVVEHTLMEQTLPGVMLSPIADRYEFGLFAHAHAAWSEYVAERTSASFGPSFHAQFQELLEGAVRQQVEEIAKARAALEWWDPSTSQAVGEITIAQVGKTMKFAGYLFGHADGRDVDPFLGCESLKELIDQQGLMPWLESVQDGLRTLFDTRDDWTSLEEHFTLNRSLEQGCNCCGLTVYRSERFAVGWRVDFV
jgi:hypothetical protein